MIPEDIRLAGKIKYTKDKFDLLKSKFNKCEEIEENSSQAYQDMFILSMLNGKENGTYLEIGADDGKAMSNTYLLEKQFNWGGISIDIRPESQNLFESHDRKSKLIIDNALNINFKEVMDEYGFGKQIDYLQLDIEPPQNTLTCLKNLPLNEYRFSVITYETDFYSRPGDELSKIREESRKILLSHGYEMIVGDVCNIGGDPFEDWYVDPTVIDKDIIKLFKQSSDFNDVAEKVVLDVS